MSIVYVTKTFVLIAIKMQIIVLLSYCGLMNSSVRIKVRGKRFSYLFMSLYFLYRVMFGKEFLTGKSVRGEIAVQCLLCVNIK